MNLITKIGGSTLIVALLAGVLGVIPQAAFAAIDPTPACPFQPSTNKIVVKFPDLRLVSPQNFPDAGTGFETSAVNVNLPAGNYRVSLFAHDGYDGRNSVSQPKEQYVVRFWNGSTVVATSNATNDLQDNVRVATWQGVVNNSLNISQNVTKVTARHAHYIDNSSPNSLNPVCAMFEKLDTTPDLGGSCAVTPSNPKINQTVTWSASATGGNGNYSYSWSGTDGLSGNSSSVSKSYGSTGTKTGTVTITSNGKSITRDCTVYIEQPTTNNLSASCAVSNTNPEIGETVTWMANPSGGTGSYSYSWSGTNGLSGSSKNVSRSYSSTGSKTGTVTVTSGGQSVTANCTLYVQKEVDDNLNVSCSVSESRIDVGDRVTWRAHATGGTGNYYYDWSGTDNLRGDSRTVSKRYDDDGRKRATVTVTSGNQSRSATCYLDVEEEDEDLRVSCDADKNRVRIGEIVRFTADARGGTGRYSYDWSGAGVSGSSRTLRESFDTTGIKRVRVTVESGREKDSDYCEVEVVGTTVTVTTDTLPPSYVYLSQVPYTGIGDNVKIASFVLMLLAWSGFISYMIIRKRARKLVLAQNEDVDTPLGSSSETIPQTPVQQNYNAIYAKLNGGEDNRNFLDNLVKNNNL